MKPIAQLGVERWLQLNRLLQQALELEREQRASWLSSLPADSMDLRPLLEKLLAESSTVEFAGTGVTLHPGLPMTAAALAGMQREQAGDRIGPWSLERLIGEGGMGTVWLAQRADGVMQRAAALKLPRAEWVDRGLADRIARERSILALLQHPHIAVLYDAGVTETGRPYLALEYVEGQTIKQFCEQQAVDLESLLKLFVKVIRAVAYAHAKLVIHRDLKPGNVLVTVDGNPKLLDFGIAKLIAGADTSTEETALTRLSGRPLTLSYAAPEQILGGPISVAADIYALGVMLYELLSGARPYLSKADAPRALEQEILQGRIRRPSDAAVAKDRARALRGDLDAIVLKALRTKAEDRYETAAAFADDIERKLDGRPVRAQPDSRTYRLRKFVTRNRIPVAAGGSIFLALGVGLGVALWQAGIARATAMSTFVLSLIQQADPQVSQASRAADLAMLKAIEQRVEKEFKGNAGELLQLRTTVARAYVQRGHHDVAGVLIRRALEEAEASLPSDDLRLLNARALHASMPIDEQSIKGIDGLIDRLRSKGPEAAEALVDALLGRVVSARLFGRRPGMTWDTLYFDSREAFDLAGRHLSPASGRQLRAAMALSIHLTRGDGSSRSPEDRSREAIDVLELALANARADPNVRVSNKDLMAAEGFYGYTLCRDGKQHEGMRRLWETLAVARAHHTDDSTAIEVAYTQIADCLRTMGDLEAAVAYYILAYDLVQQRNTTIHQLTRNASYIADMMCDAQRTAECVKFVEKAALHVSQMPAGEQQSYHAARLRPLQVRALIARGETKQAEALALESLQTTDCCEISLRWQLSVAQRANGKLEEAVRSADAALSLLRREGRFERGEATLLVNRATVEMSLGQAAQALATVESAMPAVLKIFPVADVIWGNAYLVQGQALLASGRPEEAIEALRKAYGFWLGHDPKSIWAAEAEYWFGQAYLANGDGKRGRWMVAEAKRTLVTSPHKMHRALAAGVTR